MNKIKIVIMTLLLINQGLLLSQNNWKAQRDWVIGEYVGYQVDSTSRPDIKVPFEFQIKYLSDRIPERDTIVSIYPKNLWFKVRKDSLLVLTCCSEFWLNEWGKLYPDSTLEFLYIEPFMTGGHRVYNWGKRVKSYVVTEDIEDTEVFNIWPNPSTDYLNLSDADMIKSISIFNSQGIKLLYFSQVTNQKIDISILPEGLYWIQIFSDGKIITKQFFKNNIK